MTAREIFSSLGNTPFESVSHFRVDERIPVQGHHRGHIQGHSSHVFSSPPPSAPPVRPSSSAAFGVRSGRHVAVTAIGAVPVILPIQGTVEFASATCQHSLPRPMCPNQILGQQIGRRRFIGSATPSLLPSHVYSGLTVQSLSASALERHTS